MPLSEEIVPISPIFMTSGQKNHRHNHAKAEISTRTVHRITYTPTKESMLPVQFICSICFEGFNVVL